jgi:hypothetical protein
MQIQRGFLDIVPMKVLKKMSVADLEAALAGEPDVDVADWYMHTYYVSCMCIDVDEADWYIHTLCIMPLYIYV